VFAFYDDKSLIVVTLHLKYFFSSVTKTPELASKSKMDINIDQHIINQILNGDTQAFSILVDRYKDLVFNIALRMLKQREEAEEVAQDVFVKVFNSLSKFKGDSKLSTWIYKVAYNSCLDVIKKNKRRQQEIEIDKFDNFDIVVLDNAFDKLVEEDKNKAIKQCIEQLYAEDNMILTLYYFEELSLQEISEIINISPNTVKVKLHRARKRLGVIMKKELKNEIIESYGK